MTSGSSTSKIGIFGIFALIITGVAIGVIITCSSEPIITGILGAALLTPLLFFVPILISGILLCFPPFFILWRSGGISPLELAFSLTFLGLLAISIIKYFVGAVFGERKQDIRSPILLPLILFLGLALLAAINAVIRGTEFRYWASDLNGLSFYAMYFIIAMGVTKPETIKKLFYTMVLASVIGVFWNVYIRYTGKEHYPADMVYIMGKVFTRYGLPTAAGMVMFLVSFSMAVYIKPSFKKWFFVFLCALFSLEQVATLVRTRWVGDIFGCAFILFATYRQSKTKVFRILMIGIMLLCVVIMLVMAYPSEKVLYGVLSTIEKRFSSIFVATQEPAVATRVSEWQEALKKAWQSPIFGNGLGSHVRYYRYDIWYGYHTWENTRYIHNSYIFLFLNMGLVGLFSFCYLCFAFIRYGMKVVKQTTDEYYKGLVMGFTATFVAFVVSSLSGPVFTSPILTTWIGFMMGGVYIIDLKNRAVNDLAAQKQGEGR